MQNWDLIRAFLALHRAGTFEGAAQLLSADHSTLRRRIQSLEQTLGSTLFSRQDGRYTLLPAMQPLLEAALRVDASSRDFFEGTAPGEAGVVRVTMLDFVACWLAPDIATFRTLHPEIQLDISTEHSFVDLESEMIDVAIRLARPTRGKSHLRKLGVFQYGIFGSKAYFERHGRDLTLGDHELLTASTYFPRRGHEFLMGEGVWSLERLPPGQTVFCTDSYLVLRTLCESGLGLALLPNVLGEASDGLVRISSDTLDATCDVWSVVHSDTGRLRRVRAFLDFVASVFAARLPHSSTASSELPEE